MTHTILILAIVCGAMFVATKTVDLIFNWLGITHKKEGIQPGKSEQITGRVLDSLQLQEYSSLRISAINTCETEAGICSDAGSLEALSEGLQATAESVGEHISIIIEGLSRS